ncbi:hypothetical protein B0A55_06873 [Friedmanniomyces simplex]|uniref:Heterokaryon incompatibility domain-containing protein n=1 Tax=Friedmanniomyces simplex TaxID=329884 RepID=A0A4U0WX87_9PEZI|nr:hypothetical protein B0A55_06873 [Friedmanniomyces simplex]
MADARQQQQHQRADFVSSWDTLHSNFSTLDQCASQQGCVACQVFRRALLLKHVTNAYHSLRAGDAQEPVFVRLRRNGGVRVLEVSTGTGADQTTALVALSSANVPRAYPRLTSTEPLHPSRTKKLRGWISSCHAEHSCGNYKFSGRRPTWLIQITSPERLRLVPGNTVTPPYVALSYCWGDKRTTKASELEAPTQVEEPYATNFEKRTTSFATQELSATLKDAIAITHALGVGYIWIDSVCVPQGSWDTEAIRMHEIYGNAYFTLSSSSTVTATDPMLVRQEAWADDIRGCRLYEPWLLNTDMPLDEVRLKAPLAARGWCLQEERLSPRMLYWCAQRAYWACVESQHVEFPQPGGFDYQTIQSLGQQKPQGFLELCRRGDPDALRSGWCDVVASYARRSLSEIRLVDNRFAAFSGLAVRYLNARRSVDASDEYLAGLWSSSIAEDLAWIVKGGGSAERSLQRDRDETTLSSRLRSIPSWSWLSLPLGTEMEMSTTFEPSSLFELECVSSGRPDRLDVEIVADGATVKAINVTGCFRPLISTDPEVMPVPWDFIERLRPGSETWYDFSFDPELPVYARHEDGRILVYEPHKEEVIGQLDYHAAVGSIGRSFSVPMEVAYGQERQLRCLEVGTQAMLLLELE